jgi:hypothetical protein
MKIFLQQHYGKRMKRLEYALVKWKLLFTPTHIPSNFMVPFLGICKEEVCFVLDPTEVSSIIELPLSVFLSDKIIIEAKLITSTKHNVPAFDIEGHVVWGATMMLSELKDVLKSVLR